MPENAPDFNKFNKNAKLAGAGFDNDFDEAMKAAETETIKTENLEENQGSKIFDINKEGADSGAPKDATKDKGNSAEKKEKNKKETSMKEDFDKAKGTKEVQEAISKFYEEHGELKKKGIKAEEFTDNVINKLLRYEMPVDSHGKPVKKGKDGISIEDIVRKPEYASTLVAVVNGAAFEESEEILGRGKKTTPDIENKTENPKENIEKIKKELEIARKEYAQDDYEINDALNKVRGKIKGKISAMSKRAGFGKEEEKQESDQKEENGDVKFYREEYEKKLKEYTSAKLAEFKAGGLKGKDLNAKLEELTKYIITDERANLHNTQADIRIKKHGETLPGKGFELFIKGIEKYKKLPTKYKIALSVGLLAGGAGAAALGFSTVAVGIVGGRVLLRGVGATVAGYGVAGMNRERLAKKAEEQKKKIDEKERQEMMDKMEKLSEEEKIKHIEGLLGEKILEADKKLQEMKSKSAKMTGRSIAVGTAAGLLLFNLGNIANATGLSDKIHSLILGGHNAAGSDFPVRPTIGRFADQGVLPGGGANAGLSNMGINDIAEGKSPSVLSPIAENAPEGHGAGFVKVPEPTIDANGHVRHSGIIRALQEHLKGNQSISNPNQEAERIFANSAKEYAKGHGISVEEATEKLSRIHPGTEFEVTGDGKNLHLNLDDSKIKFMDGAGHHHPTGGGHYTHEPLEAKPTEVPKTVPEVLSEAKAHPQISQNIEEIKSQIGQFKEQLQHRGDLIREIHSTQSEYDKLFEKSVNDDEFTRMNKAFDEKRLGEKLIELKQQLLVTDENLGKMHENLKNAHESIINNKTSSVVGESMNASRPGYNGAGVMTHLETQHTAGGNIHVTEDISKTHGHISGFENASGHFDSSHPLKLGSGSRISFAYNENGAIVDFKTEIPPRMMQGVTGKELFAENFDQRFSGMKNIGQIKRLFSNYDKLFVGHVKIYNELLAQGHKKEADAVLYHTYRAIRDLEGKYNLSGIFDRSKLPTIKQ